MSAKYRISMVAANGTVISALPTYDTVSEALGAAVQAVALQTGPAMPGGKATITYAEVRADGDQVADYRVVRGIEPGTFQVDDRAATLAELRQNYFRLVLVGPSGRTTSPKGIYPTPEDAERNASHILRNPLSRTGVKYINVFHSSDSTTAVARVQFEDDSRKVIVVFDAEEIAAEIDGGVRL